MEKQLFRVTARLDPEARVYCSDSDIDGLHIEAATISEFEAEMLAHAADLVISNHLERDDIAGKPISEYMPPILWQPPFREMATD